MQINTFRRNETHPREELLIDIVLFVCVLVVKPRAHFGERDEEPDARTERVVMPLGLECRSGQIGRDDVQMEVSFFFFIFIFTFSFPEKEKRSFEFFFFL